LKIIGASTKLSQAYRNQVESNVLLKTSPRFGEYMAIDYALAAADDALAKASISARDVDLIISMSISPDHIADQANIVGPRLCHPLQRELGSLNAVVLDLHDACWAFAFDTACCFMREMGFQYALIVRADCVTGLDTRQSAGWAWDSGAGVLVVESCDSDNWEVTFTRLKTEEKTARIELLDPGLRFRGDYRAALYFLPGSLFSMKLTDALEAIRESHANNWTPYIEPWGLSDNREPQFAPYAFPMALSSSAQNNYYDGLITFDPFRMLLGACKVQVA
jgi:hypothetical protein